MSAEKNVDVINHEHEWNQHHEKILRQWGEAAACYRYMHHRSFLMYKRLSLKFNLPVIILSTITGTANFAQTTLPVAWQSSAPSVIGGLNLVAGLIATIMQFLKINELRENHRSSSLAFGQLSRNIRLTLQLPRNERNKAGIKFVDECKSEYDRLIDQSPPIPKNIMILFENEYPIEGQFTKPEILNVRAIPVTGAPNGPKMAKTIEPVEAITTGTAFESIGKAIINKKNPPKEEEEEEFIQTVEVDEDGKEVVISEDPVEKDVEKGEEERR